MKRAVGGGKYIGEIDPPSVMYGDVDGDGEVTSTDYAYVKRYLLGLIYVFPSEKGLLAADVDADREITSTDYAYIKRYLLGIINEFPATNNQ